MSVCVAAFFFFFLEIKYLLDRLFFFSFTSAQPFCLLPTSPCLPVFQGKRSPQLPSPPSLVCRVGASSARPLNEFHMALQAAVSAQDTQKSHTQTQSKGSKVTPSRPRECNCLEVESRSVKTPNPFPPICSAAVC